MNKMKLNEWCRCSYILFKYYGDAAAPILQRNIITLDTKKPGETDEECMAKLLLQGLIRTFL